MIASTGVNHNNYEKNDLKKNVLIRICRVSKLKKHSAIANKVTAGTKLNKPLHIMLLKGASPN